ncbi:unnamed protein product [Orchesella dallaii]|uniref:Uncharacterized protein n=1 Tax=Orchesella dallaii TaxID=48710 RepID=A0ABP1S9B5_9HEXA
MDIFAKGYRLPPGYHVLNRRRIDIDENLNLATIEMAWDMAQMLAERKRDSVEYTRDACTQLNSLHYASFVINRWMISCMYSILLSSRNFSIADFPLTQYESMKKPGTDEIQFNLQALLYPFSGLVWFLIIITVIVVAALFSATGRDNSIQITLFILLEQTLSIEVPAKKINIGTPFILIILWLFVVSLFRNFYTSTMYSFITSEPIPTIPTSFKELVDDYQYPLVGRSEAMRHLVEQTRTFVSAHNISNGSSYHQLLIGRNLANGKEIPVCNLYTEGNFTKSKCGYLGLEKFAYVYSYPIDFSINIRDEFIVAAFASRRVFTNTDRLRFVYLGGYHAGYDLRVKTVNRVFGILKQSGILDRWTIMFTLMNMANQLKGIYSNLNSKRNWDFFSLVSTLVPDVRGLKETIDFGIGDLEKKEKTQVQLLAAIWILYGILCIIGFGVFIAELTNFMAIWTHTRVIMKFNYAENMINLKTNCIWDILWKSQWASVNFNAENFFAILFSLEVLHY